ncbi:MAG: TonB-dependent receptor [Acidobacteria bacterium]|nr:TonB-dependent receptor [Acidobacteriota bacterium]
MQHASVYVLLLSLILSFAPADSSAQSTTGDFNGRVTDASGAVIPGVEVTLISAVIQGERSSITDESGNYRFILLPPGSYTVKYSLPGFQTLIREGIIIEVGRATTLNVSLGVAALAETVTVSGESPVVDVQNVNVATSFNQTLLDSLPNARDIWAVLRQTPGIQMSRVDVGGSTMGTQTGYRAYGRSGQNWVTLDGVATTEGTSGAGFYFDYGSFSEISISAAGNSAEVAVPGVVTNTVIKTGGNDFKGEVYLDWEDDKFQGTNLTEELKDKGIAVGDKFERYNDFNANAGGPIIKDRLWWFYAYHNQYSGIYTQLRRNDGTPGAVFYTRIKNQSAKVNYQLNARNQLIFSMQPSRKLQPYRGGSGTTAVNYIIESTEFQDGGPYWTAKGQWNSVLSNRMTLDVSSNLFHTKSTRKSHVDKTPWRDTVTQAIRGGFPNRRLAFRTRWQNYATLALFTDNFLRGSHDFKFGYGVIHEDNTGEEFGAPGDSGTLGHAQLFYANGVPDEFRVTDTPVKDINRLFQNYFFIQDKWQVTRRLTLNLGVRFDRYSAYLPEQGNPGTGPYSVKNIYPRRDVTTFNNAVPRLSFVLDLFGNTKTALKGGWGRFAENTGTGLAESVNPVVVKTYSYAWDGRLPITPQVAATSRLINVSGQTAVPAVDPNLKNALTDEYTLGLEHELFPNFGISATFVREFAYNRWTTFDRAYSVTDYSPLQAIDVGRDGVVGTADDTRVTIFERMAATRESDGILRNIPGGENWSGVEISATKRMSNKWMLLGGFEWDRTNSAPPVTTDPNLLVWGNSNNSARAHYTSWGFKMLGQYELPKGFKISSTYDSQKGAAYRRDVQFNGAGRNMLNPNGTVRTTNLRQGSQTLAIDPIGTYFMPTVRILNLRIDKTFKITDNQSLEGMFDLFNIFNAATITGVEQLSNTVRNRRNELVPRFGRATTITGPIIFRIGARYRF